MTATDADRAAVVARAIDLLNTADPADLARYLATTNIHDHLKADPSALARALADPAIPSGTAYRAAVKILTAAGRTI